MKKHPFFFLMICIHLLFFNDIFANENPETLLINADSEIFIKAGYKQEYSETQGYVNEFVSDGNVLHQYFIKDGMATETLTSLQPSPETVSVTNKRLKFDDRRAKVFHMSYQVKRSEAIPADGGYCWVRYSDAGKGNGVILYPGYKAFAFTTADKEIQYTEIADLSQFDISRKIKLDVIRLDGISYFYFNGVFGFQYEDNINNTVSFEGGSELFERANRIRCDFDNFTFLTL